MEMLVNIDVENLEQAANFYTSAFGLRPGRRIGAAGLELLGAAVPIWLLQKAAGSAAGPATAQARSYQRHWTPLHLDIVVDDIEAALRRALAAGAIQEAPLATHAWGKLALMADPFGHGFCLIQFLGRGYDEICDAC
ncbi:MAG: VOC family protein [Massilia sp.]